MDELTRLAVSARNGYAGCFEIFVRKTKPHVWRFCARMTDPQRADDLVQDTYLRAWTSLSTFRAESQARSWLLGVASHVVADHIRRVARRARLLSVAGLTSQSLEAHAVPRTAVPEPDRSDELATFALLDGLDRAPRAAFVLTQVIGCSYAETAEITGVPVGTVRSRVARARHHLIDAHRQAVAR